MAHLQTGTIDSSPKPTRTKARTLETSDLWIETKAKLAAGLKPYEAFWIEFDPSDKEKYDLKNPARTFRALVLETVRKLNLKYDVDRFLSSGREVVRISNPVISKRDLESREEVTLSKKAAGRRR